MLSRHVHRLFRDWVFYRNHLQRYLQNAQAFQCLKCVEYYSWACYPHLNLQNFGENWRLPLFWNLQLSTNLWQNYFFHFCTAKMKSEDYEPVFKKRRESEVQDISCTVEKKINVSSFNEKSSSPLKEENTPKLKRLIKRHWEYFRHQSKKTTIIGDKMQVNQDADPQATFDFTVMSYNILSQDLLEYNPHLYKHCQQQILSWNYRFPNILADIKQLDADVLCLQEVQEDQYGVEIKPSLEALGTILPLYIKPKNPAL